MKAPQPTLAFVGLLIVAVPAAAADLTAIERKIAKEPAYQSESVKYCLLVFGPEAMMRVWLAQDGGTLYIDRNGNGDLTEGDEKVAAKECDETDPEAGVFLFEAGDIQDGKLTHRNLRLQVSTQHLTEAPGTRAYYLRVEMAVPGLQGSAIGGRIYHHASAHDFHGILAFATTPAEAPVIHFGGPLQVTFASRSPLTAGREQEVYVSVGTPGLGKGTTAFVEYEGVIPEEVHPQIKITYPPRKDGDRPLSEIYELRHRC